MTTEQEYVDEQLRRATTALASRFIALWIYGTLGILVGLAMITTGAPSKVEDSFGPWTRLVLGLLAFAGGLLTIIGAPDHTRSRGRWVAALVGTTLLSIWGTAMAVSYFLATLHAGFTFAWPWQRISDDSSRLYVPLMYECLFGLFVLHVITLAKLRPRLH